MYQKTHQISLAEFQGEIASVTIASSSQDNKRLVLTVYPGETIAYHVYKNKHIHDTIFNLEEAVDLYNQL